MNEKRNLFNLVDIVSAQTKLDPKIVRKFITQLFKEIEKELVESSFVQVDNLGIFRIIKSLSSEKILFLGKFKGDINGSGGTTKERSPVIPLDEVVTTREEPENKYIKESFPDIQEINHFDNNTTINSDDEFINSHLSDLDSAAYNDADFTGSTEDSDPYGLEEDKKKISTKAKIFVLSLITVIGVAAILYFLYPTNAGAKVVLPYVEIKNSDTVNYLRVIKIESNTNFVSLSESNYGHEVFWPYIYLANDLDSNILTLEIKEGTIIKIPRMGASLIDIENEVCLDSVKRLEESIFLKIRNNNAAKRSNIPLPDGD